MRGTTLLAFLAQMTICAAPLCAQAQSANLPPPPYQTSSDPAAAGLRPALPAPSPQSLDRYGGGAIAPSASGRRTIAASSAPPARPIAASVFAGHTPGRFLSWSGKTLGQTAAPPQAQDQARVQARVQGDWTNVVRRWDAQAPQAPQTPQAQGSHRPDVTAWRPYSARAADPQARIPAAPTSIYDAGPGDAVSGDPVQTPARTAGPQTAASQSPSGQLQSGQLQSGQASSGRTGDAQAAPIRTAQAQPYQGGPRFYSLHRDYGIQPNAIPIPPQFFGPTADLSAPPADPVLKRVTTSSGATHTEAVPSDDQGGQ